MLPLYNEQVCLGYIAARFVVILYQTYQPLYYIDTLMMDKVSFSLFLLKYYCYVCFLYRPALQKDQSSST